MKNEFSSCCFCCFQAQICKKQAQSIKNDLSQSAFGQDLTQEAGVRSKTIILHLEIFCVVFQLQVVSRAPTQHSAQKTIKEKHKRMGQNVQNGVGVKGAALVFQGAALRSGHCNKPQQSLIAITYLSVPTYQNFNAPTCQSLMHRC